MPTDNNKRYGVQSNVQSNAHRRAASISHHLEGLHPGPELSGMLRPVQTPNTVDADVFPPLRAQSTEPSIFLPYVTEDIAFEEEYEEYLRWSKHSDTSSQGSSAWARLPELVHDIADSISDSESIVSISELADDARLDTAKETRDVPDENVNNWEVSDRFEYHAWAALLRIRNAVAYEPEDDGCARQVPFCTWPQIEQWERRPSAYLAVRFERRYSCGRRGRR